MRWMAAGALGGLLGLVAGCVPYPSAYPGAPYVSGGGPVYGGDYSYSPPPYANDYGGGYGYLSRGYVQPGYPQPVYAAPVLVPQVGPYPRGREDRDHRERFERERFERERFERERVQARPQRPEDRPRAGDRPRRPGENP